MKTLRWPLLALFFSIILMGVALYLQFTDDDDDQSSTPVPDTSPVVQATSTPPPIDTPIPTVRAVDDSLDPVPGQLTEALVGNIGKLNPLFASFNPVDRDITALIFEGLTTVNRYGETVPDLAQRWEVSRDGLEYVFLLRRDILWQDGVPFTTADVYYTIDTIRNPDFPGDPALTEFWRTVEMTVIDEYTIRFRLVQPLSSFPEQLRIGMLPVHALEGYPVADLDRHPFNLNPIGTGPYQRETLFADRGQFAISLRVAPTYRQRPEGQTGYAVDRIVFRTYSTLEQAIAALARGEVNSVGHVPIDRLASLNSLSRLSVYTSVMPSVVTLIYNWQRDDIRYVQNQRVRLAFAHGIDRIEVVQRTLPGQAIPAQSPLIPGSWAYDSSATYPVYDLSLAQSMLQDVNFEELPTSDEAPVEEATPSAEPEGEATPQATEPATAPVRRELSLIVLSEIASLAEEIASQWSQLDFTINVEALDADSYQQRLTDGDFDAAIVEYSYTPYADPDPYAFWHISQIEDGANYGGMAERRISEILERARRETLGINRVALYHEFQQLFTERAPALTLYHPLYAYVIDERLEGVQLGFITTPADRFRTIQDWQWE